MRDETRQDSGRVVEDLNPARRNLDENTVAELERLGALKPEWLRDRKIRARWAELRDAGFRSGIALTMLSSEYRLSEKRINAIVYPDERNL